MMRAMMRINPGICCALTGAILFVACSFGGSSGSNPQPDSSTSGGAHCGDGVCAASEVNSCPADCGSNTGSNNQNAVCGNGMCETTKGETAQSCPSDCGMMSGSNGSGMGTCPADPNACIGCAFTGTGCPAGLDMNGCLTCLLGGIGSGGGSGACNFNGVCDAGEDNMTCPSDCP
jgi:hypothetical protein